MAMGRAGMDCCSALPVTGSLTIMVLAADIPNVFPLKVISCCAEQNKALNKKSKSTTNRGISSVSVSPKLRKNKVATCTGNC